MKTVRMALNEARRLKMDTGVVVVGLPCASFSVMLLGCTYLEVRRTSVPVCPGFATTSVFST